MEIFRYAIAGTAFVLLLILETVFPLFSGWKNRFRHIVRNIGVVIVNNLIFFIGLAFATAYIFRTIEQQQIGLFNYFSLPSIVRLAFIILVFDLWMYIWHVMVHRSSFLWRFHRMHHSDPNMDVSTALRFHPGEIILSTILRWGIFLLLGVTAFDLLLYETIMLPIIFFHHSNYYLPEKVDKILRSVIVTPWMHWVHHSHIFEETNSNYGTIFSWWDRLFSTFRLRREPAAIQYGLDEIKSSNWQTFIGMLKTPFVDQF